MCGAEGARGGCGDEKVGFGWVGSGSVVSWGELWLVSCFYVGEVKCVVAPQVWPQIHFLPNLQKDTKKDRGKNKKKRGKHVISRNSETTNFLEKTCKQEIQQNKTEATAMA